MSYSEMADDMVLHYDGEELPNLNTLYNLTTNPNSAIADRLVLRLLGTHMMMAASEGKNMADLCNADLMHMDREKIRQAFPGFVFKFGPPDCVNIQWPKLDELLRQEPRVN